MALDENALNLLVGATGASELLPAGAERGDAAEGFFARPVLRAAPATGRISSRPRTSSSPLNANIGAARAAFFPRIALTTNVGTSSLQLSGLFGAGSGVWAFAPQITLPIFDAGSRLATLKVAKADRDICLAQYEKAIQTAFREAADALAQRGTVGDQIAAQEALVQASAETYSLSNARYLKGIDSYLAVLDAQRSLYARAAGADQPAPGEADQPGDAV